MTPIPPQTPIELLAELDAGALDDARAEQLRQDARKHPEWAMVLSALTTTRARLAAAPVPQPSPEQTARWAATLAGLGTPHHRGDTARPAVGCRRHRYGPRWFGALGAVAAAAALALVIVIGGSVTPAPVAPTPVPAEPGPVDTGRAPLVLSRDRLATDTRVAGSGVAGRDLGPLTDPGRLAGCLTEVGARGVSPLGGRGVLLDGRPGVLLALPTSVPGRIRLLVVAPGCAAGHAEVLADVLVGR